MIHPNGNIAEHLVAAGLARVVDWHAGMLGGPAMERFRAAERAAKEKRLCLYASQGTSAHAGKGLQTSGPENARTFDAPVIRIWSGDQLSVVDKAGKERRLQLSSVRAPKCVWGF